MRDHYDPVLLARLPRRCGTRPSAACARAPPPRRRAPPALVARATVRRARAHAALSARARPRDGCLAAPANIPSPGIYYFRTGRTVRPLRSTVRRSPVARATAGRQRGHHSRYRAYPTLPVSAIAMTIQYSSNGNLTRARCSTLATGAYISIIYTRLRRTVERSSRGTQAIYSRDQ